MDDAFFMKRVLRLARRGKGRVSPNPCVGALVVKGGKILSEGYHARFGGPHAEVAALSGLPSENSRNATLYVNLEPCVHHGKTPPCTDAIIRAGIARVIVGTVDPNPLVKGKGIDKLQKAGMDVRVGILEDTCARLNESYFKFITTRKPFITLKIAQTLDGKIATTQGDSRWITSEASRRLVHRMRKESDAVLIGVGTVVADNPELTVRWVRGKNVRRIVLDGDLCIPLQARILHLSDPWNTIVVTTSSAPSRKVQKIKGMGIAVWVLDGVAKGKIELSQLWQKMVENNIASLMVEGGRGVFTSFLRTGEVDRIVIFTAPKLLGSGIDVFEDLGVESLDNAIVFREAAWYRTGPDMVFEGRL